MGESLAASSENLDALLKWAAELGITDLPSHLTSDRSASSCLGHCLAVSYFPEAGGRGLGAIRSLCKAELVLRVPKSALITSESLLQRDYALSLAVRGYKSLSPTQVLSVCLLYEINKGKSSPWYPYLMTLPRSYELLASFNEFDKRALQIEDAIFVAENHRSKLKLEWKEAYLLLELLSLPNRFRSFKAWIWVSSTISSRTMHITWDEAGCLCPVGDLFNYAAPDDDSRYNDDEDDLFSSSGLNDDSFTAKDNHQNHSIEHMTDGMFVKEYESYCFFARRNYKKGEQVLLSYGTYTNLELLEHYGFLLDCNPNDKVFIPLESSMYSFTSWPRESMFIHPNGQPSFAMYATLRQWATPPLHRKSTNQLAYSGYQISVDNEIKVLSWMLRQCHLLLNHLPTTVEADELLLSTIEKAASINDPDEIMKIMSDHDGDGFALLMEGKSKHYLFYGGALQILQMWKLAVKWRCQYKKILSKCISFCVKSMQSLQSGKTIL